VIVSPTETFAPMFVMATAMRTVSPSTAGLGVAVTVSIHKSGDNIVFSAMLVQGKTLVNSIKIIVKI
jgi:hypothetical protein